MLVLTGRLPPPVVCCALPTLLLLHDRRNDLGYLMPILHSDHGWAGLIVVGVSITADRSIAAEDIGYLFLLFIALYIIRAFVVFLSYPVLRHVGIFFV